MHFPNELVEAIVQSLPGHGLKSARLVSKTWCSYASILLFKKIYVAPNRLDLQVFNAIAQHPIFSKYVRHLVYDDAEFMRCLTKRGYVRGLWSQTALMFDMGKLSQHDPDPQINDWVHDVAHTDFSLGEIIDKWKHCDFISRGYEEYQEHSIYQQKAIRHGEFFDCLVQGLSNLVFLETVTLGGGWPVPVPTSPCELLHGTPLARIWKTFHCLPHARSWQPVGNDDYVEGLYERQRPHWIISNALVQARRLIDEFAITRNCVHGMNPEPFVPTYAVRLDPLRVGVPNFCAPEKSPEIFERHDPMRPCALSLDIATFSGPKRLHLRLGSCDEALASDNCDNITGLQKLLKSTHILRRPGLASSYAFGHRPSRYWYDDFALAYAFERAPSRYRHDDLAVPYALDHHPDLYWYYQDYQPALHVENIKELALHNLASSATNLLFVLFIQMPNLKHVELGPTRLLYGSWESVIECLRQFNNFTSFQYQGERIFECDNGDINEYVMHGGRHPCLLDEQPTFASEAYMFEIEFPFRQTAFFLSRRHG